MLKLVKRNVEFGQKKAVNFGDAQKSLLILFDTPHRILTEFLGQPEQYGQYQLPLHYGRIDVQDDNERLLTHADAANRTS